MLILSSITIGSFGAFTEMQPLAIAEPSITISPAPTLLVPGMAGLCAVRADLVNLTLLMAIPRFRGAEWRLRQVRHRPARHPADQEACYPRCRPSCPAHRADGPRARDRWDREWRTDHTSTGCCQAAYRTERAR